MIKSKWKRNACGIFILALTLMSTVASAQSRSNFRSAVDNIIAQDFPILDYGDLAFEPNFNKVADQRGVNFQASLDLIADPTASYEERTVSMRLMYKLSPEKYILFVSKIFDLYKSGRIKEGTLEMALFTEHSFGEIIIYNYKLPSERALLSKIIYCHCLSKNNSQWLFKVLTGAAYRESVEFYRNCCGSVEPAPGERRPH